MAEAAGSVCDRHPDRFECPDALLHYGTRTGEYGIIIHDGGSSVVTIQYCPWCGTKLPRSKRMLAVEDGDDYDPAT